LVNNEFFEALSLLEKEKRIPAGQLLERIKSAILIAVRRNYGCEDNVIMDVDIEKGKFDVYIRKNVVEEVEDPSSEILDSEASKYKTYKKADGFVDVKLDPKEFGRIAAQSAKHVIRQGIREEERTQMFETFQKHQFELLAARVLKVDPVSGNVTLEIDGSELLLPKGEQIPGEVLTEGKITRVYVVDVKEGDKGPRAMISRTHPGMVRRLFENEVSEISDGIVEIKAIAREAGSRTKMAVSSKDSNVDPVGACIGHKGSRVAKIIDELNGEKIDIVRYSDDPAEMISAALSPATVSRIEITEEQEKACKVYVPAGQLSLAIGNRGQNARLAARMTGWKIDIHSEDE